MTLSEMTVRVQDAVVPFRLYLEEDAENYAQKYLRDINIRITIPDTEMALMRQDSSYLNAIYARIRLAVFEEIDKLAPKVGWRHILHGSSE